MFIETNGAKSVLECIKKHSCVVVTGSSGMGKSSLVRHVALQMQEEGFNILPVSNPEEIEKWYDPSKKILYVVDNFCGTYTLNPLQFERWKYLTEKIKQILEKKAVKLMLSCRLQVYRDEKLKSLPFCQSCECNLLSEDFRLSETEKQSIAKLYLKANVSKITEFYDIFDCFPLLCHLYSKNTKLNIVDFFKNPFTVYKEEINKLQIEGANGKYCALALCVMFNNHLNEEWLTEDVDEDIEMLIRNTYEACKVNAGTSRLVLRDELESLTHTFIRKDGKEYRTIHDKLFDFIAFYFGSVMIQCLIKNATSQFIHERFLFESGSKKDEFIIIVPELNHIMYLRRMIDDWSKGNIVDVFSNINMKNKTFRDRIFKYLTGLEIPQQKQLASLYDLNDNSTPLLQCCFIGDIDLVQWCLHHCCKNVNHRRFGVGISALYMACQEGHTRVVQMLIDYKADIKIVDNIRTSPMLVATVNGHTEVVSLLRLHGSRIIAWKEGDSVNYVYRCNNTNTQLIRVEKIP